jgi:ADP-heptose:LPS heptosyltransferase
MDESTLLDKANILNLSQEIEDFEDTAAICKCMDLVISVDTSVAHLAGAIETPTWILLPYSPDWRWSVNKQTTPWYPSVKLYRQKADRLWEHVLSEVANDLNKINIKNKSS